MTLGTKLHNLRRSKNISFEKLAFEIEILKTAIMKWEADKAKPSVENLLKLLDYYETDIYSLLQDVSNVNFSGAKFKGSSYVIYPSNSTINYSNSPELIESIQENQKKITELIILQSDLILKLINK